MERRSARAHPPARSPLWPFANRGHGTDAGSDAALPELAVDAIAGALDAAGRRALRLVDRAARAWHDPRLRALTVVTGSDTSHDIFPDKETFTRMELTHALAAVRAFSAATAAGRLPALRDVTCLVHFHRSGQFYKEIAAEVCHALPPLAAHLEALDLDMYCERPLRRCRTAARLTRCVAALTRLTSLALTANLRAPPGGDATAIAEVFCAPWPWPSLQVGRGSGAGAPRECMRTVQTTRYAPCFYPSAGAPHRCSGCTTRRPLRRPPLAHTH